VSPASSPDAYIKTFAADGERLRDSTPARAARLLHLGIVAASRNRRGRINSIQFVGVAGSRSIRQSAHMGQQYSYEQKVLGRGLVWAHKDLIGTRAVEALFGELSPAELNARELFVRAIFRAVPLSCLTDAQRARPASNTPDITSKAPSKVVSIADYSARRRKSLSSTSRPLEFDSELRAA
jgi:hypothetical protein